MLRKFGSIALVAGAAALAVVASATARPAASDAASSSAAAVSCKSGVQIGMLAPITGPVGSIGSD